MKRGWIIVSLVAATIIICGCALFSGMYVVGTFLDYAEELEGTAGSKSTLPTTTPFVNRLLPVDGPSGLETDANETLNP